MGCSPGGEDATEKNREREVSHVEPVTGADSSELYTRPSAVPGVQD